LLRPSISVPRLIHLVTSRHSKARPIAHHGLEQLQPLPYEAGDEYSPTPSANTANTSDDAQ